MMKYLRYLLITLCACLAFILIDDVYAASSYQVDIDSIGQSALQFTSSTGYGTGKGFSDNGFKSFAWTDFAFLKPDAFLDARNEFSVRLQWLNIPASVLKGYDKISFIVGYNMGYANTMQLIFRDSNSEETTGWVQCSPISLPGSSGQIGTAFTSFSCSIDGISIRDDKTYEIYTNSYMVNSFMVHNNGDTTMNATTNALEVFYSRRATFYTSDNHTMVDSIKEQTDAINKQTESIDKVDDTLNNSDTGGAGDTANSFFGDFEDKDFGLSDIITMPLQTIKNITSATCSPLTFPLPFVDTNMSLPCMSQIYSKFGSILTIYQTITFGMIAYWVTVNIFATVRNFKNPDSDEIEVVSL